MGKRCEACGVTTEDWRWTVAPALILCAPCSKLPFWGLHDSLHEMGVDTREEWRWPKNLTPMSEAQVWEDEETVIRE